MVFLKKGYKNNATLGLLKYFFWAYWLIYNENGLVESENDIKANFSFFWIGPSSGRYYAYVELINYKVDSMRDL